MAVRLVVGGRREQGKQKVTDEKYSQVGRRERERDESSAIILHVGWGLLLASAAGGDDEEGEDDNTGDEQQQQDDDHRDRPPRKAASVCFSHCPHPSPE